MLDTGFRRKPNLLLPIQYPEPSNVNERSNELAFTEKKTLTC
jgi:hypothetical protein